MCVKLLSDKFVCDHRLALDIVSLWLNVNFYRLLELSLFNGFSPVGSKNETIIQTFPSVF